MYMFRKEILALSIILVAAPCWADGGPSDVNAQHTEDDSGQLTEITVTAMKRAESILSTPVAVSAIDKEMLKNIAPRTAVDLASVAPSLQISAPAGPNYPVYSLRGVTQNDYTSVPSGPIATYVDEVYHSGPAFFSRQIYDLDRIEVLSGPQGTLYGKNATGGAINFVTTKPGFDTQGYVDFTVGAYGERDTAGAFQTGLTDTLAMRVAFATTHTDGWQTNINPGGQDLGGDRDYGIRLSLLFRPVDSLEMILRLATSGTGPSSWATVAQPYPSGIGGGIYTQFHNLYPASNPKTEYFPTFDWQHTAITGIQREDGADHDVSLTMTWHALPTLDVVSISAYNRGFFNYFEPNGTNSPLFVLGDYETASGDQVSQDLRVVSHGDSRTNYIGGIYLSRDRLRSQFEYSYATDIDFNGDGQLNYKDCLPNLYPYGCRQENQFRQERKSIAAYGDGTTRLTDALSLRYGVRFTRDKLDIENFSATTLGSDFTPLSNEIPGDPTNPFAQIAPLSRTYQKTTGRIGLDYTLPDRTLLYATLSQGYRGGAFNTAAIGAPEAVTIVPPEILDAAELGWKGEYLDHRLQLMSAIFLYRYKNEQALNVDPNTLVQNEISIARSTIKGAELQLTGKPVPRVTARLNVSLLDGHVNNGTLNGVDITGHELPLDPKITVNANVTWQALNTAAGKLSLFVAERYVTRQYTDLVEDTNEEIDTYATTDGRATFDFSQSPLSVSLFVRNLTDKMYGSSRSDLAYYGYVYNHVGDPRTYGAEVHYSF
jgi:iron complex outermembrane receptor protein